MTTKHNPFRESAPPFSPGKGFRFLDVGELVRRGDECWSTMYHKWLPAYRINLPVPAKLRNRYRRKLP